LARRIPGPTFLEQDCWSQSPGDACTPNGGPASQGSPGREARGVGRGQRVEVNRTHRRHASTQYWYEYKYRNGHRRSSQRRPFPPTRDRCRVTRANGQIATRCTRRRPTWTDTSAFVSMTTITPARRPSLTDRYRSCISDPTDAPQIPASSSTPAECAASAVPEATS
jgi:hypothetical protein